MNIRASEADGWDLKASLACCVATSYVDLAHLECLNCTLAHTYWHMLFTKMTRRLSSIVVASPSAMLSRALWTQNSLTDHNPIPHELVKRQLA